MNEVKVLELRNPHSVIAVLQNRPSDVIRLELVGDGGGAAWRQARELAEQLGISIGHRDRSSQLTDRRQGSIGCVHARAPIDLNELIEKTDESGLWLALDSVQDPQNVGAIFRVAAFFGVRGVLMGRDRTAPITSTVYDVASGGVEEVPFSFETNLYRALDRVRDAGIWVLGSSEHAKRDIYSVPRDRAWMLVVGNEERGIRPRIRQICDDLARVTPSGKGATHSLNVANATAVLLGALSRPLSS